jgi:hypothetical protein
MVWQTPEARSAVTKSAKSVGSRTKGYSRRSTWAGTNSDSLARQKAKPLDVPMAEPTRAPLAQIFEFLTDVLKWDHLHNASRLGLLLP